MSNFICDKCGKECIDSQNGYVTGCEHYPKDIKMGTWQTIETAPKDKRILVFTGHEIYAAHWVKNIETDHEAWMIGDI